MKDMSTHPLVSVVVVSCLKNQLLLRCLDGILRQSYSNLECFVYLNCTDQKKKDELEAGFSGISFHNCEENELYCKPMNLGISGSRGKYVLCLNDDIFLAADYIEEAVKAMESDKDIGILSGCLMRPDRETFDSCGLLWSKSRKPHDRGYGIKRGACYREGFVFGANGASAFFRREMLEEIKEGAEYFDERYGIYYEDLDISWRSRRKGWKSFYQPKSIAFHDRGATTRTEDRQLPVFLKKFAMSQLPHDLKLRLVRNRYITILKNDSVLSFVAGLPWILFYEIRLLAYLAFFDRQVLRDFLGDLSFVSYALKKRKDRTRAD